MRDILLGGSALLAAVQISSTLLLARKNRTGWILSIIANLIGVVYDTFTYQYGFVPVVMINLWLAMGAWRRWGAGSWRDRG